VGFEGDGMDLDTHVILAKRGLKGTYVHRRYESGEETTDLKVAHEWGKTCYLHSASVETLVLRRPRDHSYADENLVIIGYVYQKVPNEERHLIHTIEAVRLPIEGFRKHYGKKHAEEAVNFIWELRDACARTARELRSRAESFTDRLAKLERLANAIG
jgi:hypothetical protein